MKAANSYELPADVDYRLKADERRVDLLKAQGASQNAINAAKKQEIAEDFYYYGPLTGWAYRYLDGESSLCLIMILKGRLVGIIALDAAAQAKISWAALSDVAKRARKIAHGTPSLLWLDVPLDVCVCIDLTRGGNSPEQALEEVGQVEALGVNWIGFRIDAPSKAAMCQLHTLQIGKADTTTFTFNGGHGVSNHDGQGYYGWDIMARELDK